MSPRATSARPRSSARAESAAGIGAGTLAGEGVGAAAGKCGLDGGGDGAFTVDGAAPAAGVEAGCRVAHPMVKAMGSTRTTKRIALPTKPSEVIAPIVPDRHEQVKLRAGAVRPR